MIFVVRSVGSAVGYPLFVVRKKYQKPKHPTARSTVWNLGTKLFRSAELGHFKDSLKNTPKRGQKGDFWGSQKDTFLAPQKEYFLDKIIGSFLSLAAPQKQSDIIPLIN